jgi:hypothetical protein
VAAARQHLPAIVSAALAIAVFAVTLGGTYVYDDVAILSPTLDPRLDHPSLWGKYWTESYNQGVDNLYRPLVSMSYAIQWWLHGDRPWLFHLVNLLLHALVSACVAEFTSRLLGFRAAYIAGLLFAAHPIHVEAVANIVGRAELMCAAGTFGTLILFLRPMTIPRAFAITGCFLLALLSKEQGMLVPLLVLLLGMARRYFGNQAVAPDPKRRDAMLMLAFNLCILLSGYIVYRERILKFWWDRNFLDWTINPMVQSEWHPYGGSVGRDRWLMPVALLGRYTALLIAPVRLSPDYGARVIGWSVQGSDPFLHMGIEAIVFWIIAIVVALKRRSVAGTFALLGLALTYGMVGNVVAIIGVNFAERLMYIPSAFFVILVAAILHNLSPKVLIPVVIIVTLLASVRSYEYARRWNDKLEFYRSCLAEQPGSIRLYMLLTSEHLARGQLDDADRVVKAGARMLPEYWEIWLQCGVVAMERGEWDEAQKYFDISMDIRPSIKTDAWMTELSRRRAATRPATRANF